MRVMPKTSKNESMKKSISLQLENHIGPALGEHMSKNQAETTRMLTTIADNGNALASPVAKVTIIYGKLDAYYALGVELCITLASASFSCTPRAFATLCMSLSPLPQRLTRTMCSLGNFLHTSNAW